MGWVSKGLALAGVTRSAVFTVVLVIGIITALEQRGVNVTTLLAAVGVLGLAVGFGAQSLLKDVMEIPFPRQVTCHRQEAETAPLRVQGASDGAARPGRSPASAL